MGIVILTTVHKNGLEDLAKAEELYRLALDGLEKSLGKDHEHTKSCAKIQFTEPARAEKRHTFRN